MRMLVLSDTHYFNEIFEDILKFYQNDPFDLYIHCGDSSLNKEHELMKTFDIIVKGNHDDEDFPIYQIYNNILVVHGHLHDVYRSYNPLIQLCHENNCSICFHGHTHIPTIQTHEDITFINPGSTMMNRGSYGYGTYAVVNIDDQMSVNFYHHITHELVKQNILDEGLELLEECKILLKK